MTKVSKRQDFRGAAFVALVALTLANEAFSDIAEVVLAEASNNSISQLNVTKSVLAVIAPRAEFRLLPRAK